MNGGVLVVEAVDQCRGGALGAGAEASGAQCDLSAAQVGTVQGMLQERNASCSYNMTVDEILAM